MSKSTTSILNDLIETLEDGQEGFRTAATDVTSQSVKDLFAECSLQRVKYIAELQALVKSQGDAEPADSTSLKSKVHRGWMNLKAVLTSKDEHAILAECERGEDYAVAQFKKAAEADLPPEIKATVQAQYEGVKSAHDRVRDARDRLAKK
jgi:uncharacterized protein (TIGR02284 family)